MKHSGSFLSFRPLACLVGLCGLLTGCTLQSNPAPTTTAIPTLSGRVHGGNGPVTDSTIQLYAAGATGYGSAATPLITSTTVTTDSDGAFSITGDYTCPSPTSQVYLTATGGNPGLAPGTNNTALAMMAALGNCGDLTPSTFINLNEVTTVAAVWSLAPFMSGYANVGTNSTNAAGLARAFTTANTIASTVSGSPTNVYNYPDVTTIYPQYVIDTLADVLASCVNSDGSTATDAPCANLFAAAGVTAPSDTVAAALNIAHHPGVNVSTIYGLATANASFQPTLATAPNDWLMPIMYVAYSKFFVDTAMDGSGNFWDLTQYYTSTATTRGPAYSGSMDMGGYAAEGLAFDSGGNAWAISESYNAQEAPTITVVNSSGTPIHTYTGAGISTSTGRQVFDSNGNFWYPTSTGLSIISPTGTQPLSSAYPGITAGAADTAGSMWSVNGNSLVQATLDGSAVSTSTFTGGNLSSPFDLAFDQTGAVWVLNSNSTLSKFSAAGVPITSAAAFSGGGLDTTSTTHDRPIAVDGDGNVWVANYAGNDICEFRNDGTPLSPSTGYGVYVAENVAASAEYAPAYEALSVAIDNSGDVWVAGPASYTGEFIVYGYTYTDFLGAAAPTVNPLSVAAATNTIGTRP